MARQRGGSRLYRGVFRLLEGIGLKNARARWESQSPFIQRAVPPLVIAALVILVMLPFRAPDPAAIVLLAIVYALYVMPRRVAQVGPARDRSSRFAIGYPFLIQQTNYQRFLFEVPIFNSFPSIDTMAVMAIFAMMAVGLNMVVGYAGLLDLGYVAFYALGAYTAAWLASPHASQFTLGGKPIDVNIGGIGVTRGTRRDPHLDLGRSGRRCDRHGRGRDPHRPADAAAAWRLPRDRDARVRGDHRRGRAQRRQRDARLQPHGRAAWHQPDRPSGIRRMALRPSRAAGELHRQSTAST